MAKAGQTGFEKFLKETPRRAEFTIAMVADSTTEVWVDIDTGIDDGQAWLMYGMEYSFENIDPTIPLAWISGANSFKASLQLHRNDESEILLARNDNDVIVDHHLLYTILTSGATIQAEPIKVPINNVTLQPTLRVLFRTSVDVVNLSAATAQLSGVILYDIISAPARLSSNIGTLADL